MNSAKRLYGKKSDLNKSSNPLESSFFRSKVNRKVNLLPDHDLGPGQYEISLPIVKPNYETIRKNNHTVIVKFNNNASSVFDSKSPRFKYLQSDQKYTNQNFQTFRKYKSPIELTPEKTQQNQQDQIIPSKPTQNEQIINEKRDLLERIYQKSSRQKNKKGIYKIKSKKNTIYQKQSTIDVKQSNRHGNTSLHYETVPYTERLHHVNPDLMTKIQNSKRYNSSNRSTEWSKYKQERKSFVEESHCEEIPGPGSYKLKQPKFKAYKDSANLISWQFNSTTARNPFNIKNSNPQHILKSTNLSFKYDFKDTLPGDQETQQLKKKFFGRKRSKKSISNFHLMSQKNPNQTKIDLNLQFSALHSRQNLFY